MKLMYPNHIFQSVAFSTANEVSTLPARNVGTIHKPRVWRTASSAATTLTMTPAVAQDFQFFAVIKGNAYTPTQFKYGTSSGSTTTVLYAAMSSQGLIDYWDRGTNFSAAKYYELTWTAAANDDTSVIFASPVVTLDSAPDSRGLMEQWVDKSIQTESISGQIFGEVGQQYRRFILSWTNASETLKTQIESLVNSVGLHTPFFTQISTVAPYDEFLYVILTDVPQFQAGTKGLWNFELEFQEAL